MVHMYMCDVDECKGMGIYVCTYVRTYITITLSTILTYPNLTVCFQPFTSLHFPLHHLLPPLSPSLLHIQWCTTTSSVPSSACHGRRTRLRADTSTSRVFVLKQTLIPSPRQLLWWGTIYQETRKRPMIRPLVLWWYIALKTVFIVNAMQETAHFQCKLLNLYDTNIHCHHHIIIIIIIIMLYVHEKFKL